MLQRLSILLVMTVVLSACANHSRTMTLAAHQFNQHKYQQSLRYLEGPAKKGNAEAQYAIGYMYYYGQGIVENRAEARKWFHLAANKGYPEAIQALKMMNKADRNNRYRA